jgi:hypothetical protein
MEPALSATTLLFIDVFSGLGFGAEPPHGRALVDCSDPLAIIGALHAFDRIAKRTRPSNQRSVPSPATARG